MDSNSWRMEKIRVVNPVIELDENEDLINSSITLERVCIDMMESGKMTKDLALSIHGNHLTMDDYLTTEEFLSAIDEGLKAKLQ